MPCMARTNKLGKALEIIKIPSYEQVAKGNGGL
jgi:hypothetical protein